MTKPDDRPLLTSPGGVAQVTSQPELLVPRLVWALVLAPPASRRARGHLFTPVAAPGGRGGRR